ncbi:Triose-phosphate Transporter [Mortierella alpina]|uniref:Triose-phosphate Transporter n=1 Tax=Mortierella alpina TaxID=64518 RepID=A0A9P6J7I8_MORAP|nr:Triose-phosphate Transporter [Mortierella alpina]
MRQTPREANRRLSNTVGYAPSSATASPERAFKRISLQQGTPPPSQQQQQQQQVQLDATASRKKNDSEPDDFAFQRDILSTAAGTPSLSGASASNPLPPLPVPAALATGTSLTNSSNSSTTPSSSSLSAHGSSTTNNPQTRPTPPSSVNGARTPLGSVLASTFGLAGSVPAGGASSPTHHQQQHGHSSSSSSSRSFKYQPASSSSPSSNSPQESSPHAQPIRKASLMSDSGSFHSTGTGDKSGGGSGGFRSYTPSVFINVGRTSSSLPQILMPKKRMAQNIASNLSYIAAWYFFSTALSIYNKNLMGKDNWNFNLPLFVSSIHAGLHFVITACLMHFWPDKFDATRSGKGGRITMHSYVTQVVPCAVAAALEICMANASLMYITLSFYTMIKSSTPIWVLVFAFSFGLEKPRMSLILIIAVIVVGVILTVAGETQFDMTGFILVLLAAVMSGLRWSLTQMLLQKDQLGMDNPIATLYYISPIMFVIMSMLSLVIEDPFVAFSSSEFFNDFQTGSLTLMMAAGGGFLAFAMTVAEFKLIKNTGTVTLSVAGISKEIVVISLSMLIFGDRLTFVNLLGLLVSIGGIMAYNYDKIRKMQQTSLASGDYEVLHRHSKGDNTD